MSDSGPSVAASGARSAREVLLTSGVLVVLVTVLSLGAPEPSGGLGWLAVNTFVGLVLLTPPVVLTHELGHAALAWAVGMRVRYVTLGMGELLREWDLGDFSISLHGWPYRGVTNFAPTSEALARTRLWLGVLGGPLATMLCTCGVLALWPELLTRSGLRLVYEQASLPHALLIAHGVVLLGSVLPGPKDHPAKPDAHLLYDVPAWDDAHVAEVVAVTHVWAAQIRLEREGRPGAVAALEDGLRTLPASKHLRLRLALQLLFLRESKRVLELLADLAEESSLSDEEDTYRCYLLTYASILAHDSSPEAFEWSERALAYEPEARSAKALRGLLFHFAGRRREGDTLLSEARAALDALPDVASSRNEAADVITCTALVDLREGRLAPCRQRLDEAATLDPDCPLVALGREKLAAAEAATAAPETGPESAS